MYCRVVTILKRQSRFSIMFFKLFRKPAESRPILEQDTALADALAQRVNAIEFRPSKGFLKDQQQPKRGSARALRLGQRTAQG